MSKSKTKLGNITLDKVVSFTEARNNLSTLVETLPKERYLVVTKRLEPAFGLVNVELLQEIVDLKEREVRFEKFEEARKELSKGFNKYLREKGYDPETITEEEVYKIIDKL